MSEGMAVCLSREACGDVRTERHGRMNEGMAVRALEAWPYEWRHGRTRVRGMAVRGLEAWPYEWRHGHSRIRGMPAT